MNNVNTKKKPYPEGSGLGYVANGEIGIVVGGLGKRGQPPKYTNIEFSSQIGTTYGYPGESDDDPTLELAWSITIHKSQGSEFKQVFVILPASARRLSREMLYTALTRHHKRVVLLHEAPLDELLDLSISTGSETARRLTDLFFSLQTLSPFISRTAAQQENLTVGSSTLRCTESWCVARMR